MGPYPRNSLEDPPKRQGLYPAILPVSRTFGLEIIDWAYRHRIIIMSVFYVTVEYEPSHFSFRSQNSKYQCRTKPTTVYRIYIVQLTYEHDIGYMSRVRSILYCAFHALGRPINWLHMAIWKERKMTVQLRWVPGSFLSCCLLSFFGK